MENDFDYLGKISELLMEKQFKNVYRKNQDYSDYYSYYWLIPKVSISLSLQNQLLRWLVGIMVVF